jgi:hypothetical protein
MIRGGSSAQPIVEPGLGLAKPGVGFFVAVVVGLLAASAGCSTSTNSTSTATPSPVSTTTVQETANPVFVGHWHVHDATMDISPATATIVANSGPCGPGAQGMCHETDTLTVASGDSTQLTLKVTAVAFADSTGANAPNPSPGPQTTVGDTLQLAPQAPGLLKATILQGFPAWVGGNPYWCGQGVSPSDAQQCGA